MKGQASREAHIATKAKKTASATSGKSQTKKPAAPKEPKIQEYIQSCLEDGKARDIVSIDLKGKTALADYMLIATGTSGRHIAALAENVREKVSKKFRVKARMEGQENGDWVILDAGDVIVHLFREEVRSFYNLEKLWSSDFGALDYMRYQSV